MGVKEVFVKREGGGSELVNLVDTEDSLYEVVVVVGGEIECVAKSCPSVETGGRPVVDLKGGSLLPSFYAFGPALGLTDIVAVSSTSTQVPLTVWGVGTSNSPYNSSIRRNPPRTLKFSIPSLMANSPFPNALSRQFVRSTVSVSEGNI